MKDYDFDRLETELAAADDHVRLQAVQKIILFPTFEKKQIPRFMKALLRNLKDTSTAVRYYAKKAFARLKENMGSSDLAFLFPGPADEAAVDMSWQNQPTFVYGTKEYWLYELSSVDYKIRVKAIIELSRTPTAAIGERMFEMLGEERHEHVIATLVKYLACFRDPRYFDTVVPYLKHPDNRVRANAIEGLEMVAETRAGPFLTPLLMDSDNRVRANAAKFLMNTQPQAVIGTIETMLASEHEWMRDSAVFLIGTAKPPGSEELLLRALADPEPAIRGKAAETLGRFAPSASALQALGALRVDPDVKVQEAAQKSLASLRRQGN